MVNEMKHCITSDGRFVTVGDDVLYHVKTYKYIKREKVNGKWRYWYDTPQETTRFEKEKSISPTKSIQRQAEAMMKDLPSPEDINSVEEIHALMLLISEATYEMRTNLDRYELETKGREVSRAESDVLKKERSDASNALHNLSEYYRTLNTRLDKLKNDKPKLAASKKQSTVNRGKNWVETLFKD